MRTYRFDYTVTVDGRRRSSVKTLQAYSWLDAAHRLASHACKRWAHQPRVEVNNAEVNGGLINPDLLPDIRGAVLAKVESEYK